MFPKRSENGIRPVMKSYAVNQTYFQQELELEMNDVNENDEEVIYE